MSLTCTESCHDIHVHRQYLTDLASRWIVRPTTADNALHRHSALHLPSLGLHTAISAPTISRSSIRLVFLAPAVPASWASRLRKDSSSRNFAARRFQWGSICM